MSKQKSGPVEMGGEMDYSEHDKTYNVFIVGTKYGTLICIGILIGMMVGFFTSGGFFGGFIAFIASIFIGRIIMNKLI